MLNKMAAFIRRMELVQPGDRVVCAVSGGADSVAMLFAFYLLRDRLGITLEAAHFNHHLRGAESDGDAAFVENLCASYGIPLHLGGGNVQPGKKGLEAAARDARYGFLRSLPGKIATAHTCDDNAETVLLHLVRGTGLKGLGGIAPVSGSVIRPMLTVSRRDVEAFLQEYHLPHREDSSNAGDDFLRNRLRHNVLPLLRRENPRIGENLSEMALGLREDERCLEGLLEEALPPVSRLREMPPALRRRYLERFLKSSGVPEPEQTHYAGLERLIFSPKPSARMQLPGKVEIGRVYESLERLDVQPDLPERVLPCPGSVEIPEAGVTVCAVRDGAPGFYVQPRGRVLVRSRKPEDRMKTPGGTKSLKKWMIEKKVPAARRNQLPVVADDLGVITVYTLGENRSRADNTGFRIYFREK